MAYQIEILAISSELYTSIDAASTSLNKVQEEIVFKTPSQRLQKKLFIKKRPKYKSDDVFQWLRKYKEEAKGFRPFLILVVDGFLESKMLSNLFGTVLAKEGLAVFTIYNFNQFVHDIVRFCRYYFVRYAISFIEPRMKSHDDPTRKDCIFHRKMNKKEIKNSLDTGNICESCFDKLRPNLSQEIDEAIKKLLLIVSNQHPFAIIFKGGGAKGLAFAGALLELEKHFSFDTFAGTSAGAITSVLLGAGYKPQELMNILSSTNFNEFKDAKWLGILLNLIKTRALYPGIKIEKWINDLIKVKFPDILTEIKLSDFESHTIVYSTRIKDGTLIFDSKNERKETHASFAARCSMSIPYFFSPKSIDGIRVYDGGIRNNFPIKIFMESYPKKPVIGLFLVSDSKKSGLVLGELTNIAIEGEEASIVRNNLDKIVVIDPRPIKTTDFNLNENKKTFLVCSGRIAALKFMSKNYPDFNIDKSEIVDLKLKVTKLKKLITK